MYRVWVLVVSGLWLERYPENSRSAPKERVRSLRGV